MRVCVCRGLQGDGKRTEARMWEPSAVRVSGRVARGWRARVSLWACLPCQDPTRPALAREDFSPGDMRLGFESQCSTNRLVGRFPSLPLPPDHKEVSIGILGQQFSARGDSAPSGGIQQCLKTSGLLRW